MATSTLREESREVDRLCLSVATAKQEMTAAELVAAEAQARLTGKAFSTI
jgi:outer membrane murein-binding lipoprotein Lpp